MTSKCENRTLLKAFTLALSLILLGLMPASDIQAQNRPVGVISGTVVDMETGKALPWVNIVIQETVLGTTSDMDGRFTLPGIPPGIYALQFTMIGYETGTRNDVQVRLNETTRLAIEMKETAIQTQEVVVTASKRAQRIGDSPSTVSVLNAREFEQRNQIYLEQLLEHVPGVNFMGNQINIRGSSGFSYGVGSRVLFLVDGVPVMSSDTGEIKWDLIPASQIDRVEIVKSAGSALYGSSALGGVVNVITREPSSKPETTVRISSGVYDDPPYPEWTWTDDVLYSTDLDVSHARKIAGVKTHFSIGRHQSTGYRQNGGYEKYNVAGKLLFNLTPRHNLTIQSNWQGGQSDIGLLWRNRAEALTVDEDAIGDEVHSGKFDLNAIHNYTVNKTFGLKTRASYFRNHFQNFMHDNDAKSTAQRYGIEIQGNMLLSKTHSLTFGTEETFDNVNSDFVGQHNIVTASIYVQDEMRLFPATILTLGGRFDYTDTDGDVTDQQLSPKLGFVWHVFENATFRWASGKGFRAPSLSERFPALSAAGLRIVPNLDLTPESAWSHEIGFSTPLSRFLLFDVAAFRNDYWDLIEPVPDETQTVQFINVTRARISGLETTLKFAIFQRLLTGLVGYTYLDPQDLELNETLAYRSKHMIKTSLTGHFRNMELGVDYIYNDRLDVVKVYPMDLRVSQKTFNGRFSIDFGAWSLTLNGNNLMNHMHTQVERTIMPIRHYTGTFKIKL